MPAHSSLTKPGKRLAGVLMSLKLEPHPGVIDPKRTRGHPRVTVTAERTRVRLTVTGEGIQDLHLYGPVDHERVIPAIRKEFGDGNVTVRDPFGYGRLNYWESKSVML